MTTRRRQGYEIGQRPPIPWPPSPFHAKEASPYHVLPLRLCGQTVQQFGNGGGSPSSASWGNFNSSGELAFSHAIPPAGTGDTNQFQNSRKAQKSFFIYTQHRGRSFGRVDYGLSVVVLSRPVGANVASPKYLGSKWGDLGQNLGRRLFFLSAEPPAS